MLLAIDPGKNIGTALLDEQQRLLEHVIISLKELETHSINKETRIIVGDGTGSQAVQKVLDKRGLVYDLVDEEGTSLEARSLYFKDHPPTGLMRLLPQGLRSPPELIDDYAAYAIGLRYLQNKKLEP